MNNLKKNMVPVILSYIFLPLEQAMFFKRYWLFCWGSSSHLWASRFCLPRRDPLRQTQQPAYSGFTEQPLNNELVNNTHSNAIIDQPGAYAFHLAEEHPTFVGGHWQVCNSPALTLSAGTQVTQNHTEWSGLKGPLEII